MNFFSDVSNFEYNNGLRLFVLPLPGRSVELRYCVNTGSMFEGKFLGCGLSHFLEHMLFQGCAGYSGTSASDLVARWGGSFNAYTSYDRTVVHLQIPSWHIKEAVELLNAMVRFPELPEQRFLAEREVILREFDRGFDRPEWRIFFAAMKKMFLRHPLNVPVIGTREGIASVTREMALSYHQQSYTPERSFIIVAGAVDPVVTAALIGETFGNWKSSCSFLPVLSEEPMTGGSEQNIIMSDSLSRLTVAMRLPADIFTEGPALDLLFGVLGGGAGSRLNKKLIYDSPLALSLNTQISNFGSGCFGMIAAECEPNKLHSFEKKLHWELDDLCKKGISVDELRREKYQQYADNLKQLHQLSYVCSAIEDGVFMTGNPAWHDQYMNLLKQVTVDRVTQVARNYLLPERLVTVRQLPVPPKIKKDKLAASFIPISCELPNGSHLLHVADKRVPLVEFSLILPGGGIFEPAGRCGISALAGMLLDSETDRLSQSDIFSSLDRLGADFNSSAGLNSWFIGGAVPRRNFSKFWLIIIELLTRKFFSNSAFTREQNRLIETLKARNYSPVDLAFDTASKGLFGTHPYAYSVGNAQSVSSLDKEQVTEFYLSRWIPQQVILGFAGNCTIDESKRWSEQLFQKIQWRDFPANLASEPLFPEKLLRFKLHLPRAQAVVVKMVPGAALGNLPPATMDILLHAENGLSARIFKRVREDNALSYSVGMRMFGGFHRGAFGFYGQTAPEFVAELENLFDEEISKLATTGLEKQEFDSARECAAFNWLRIFEKPGMLLKHSMLEQHYGRDISELLLSEKKLRLMTREQCNNALREYFPPPASSTAIVLPAEETK